MIGTLGFLGVRDIILIFFVFKGKIFPSQEVTASESVGTEFTNLPKIDPGMCHPESPELISWSREHTFVSHHLAEI